MEICSVLFFVFFLILRMWHDFFSERNKISSWKIGKKSDSLRRNLSNKWENETEWSTRKKKQISQQNIKKYLIGANQRGQIRGSTSTRRDTPREKEGKKTNNHEEKKWMKRQKVIMKKWMKRKTREVEWIDEIGKRRNGPSISTMGLTTLIFWNAAMAGGGFWSETERKRRLGEKWWMRSEDQCESLLCYCRTMNNRTRLL